MSIALSFDTLAYAKRLQEADIPQRQAEAQAEALRTVFDTQGVATTNDLRKLEASTDSKFDLLRKDVDLIYRELRKEIELVRSDLGGELKLHRWMLGLLAAGMGLVITGMVSLIFKAYF